MEKCFKLYIRWKDNFYFFLEEKNEWMIFVSKGNIRCWKNDVLYFTCIVTENVN